MFISCVASAANGFKKWSAAHPAAKYAAKSAEAALIGPAVSDIGPPRAVSAESSWPVTNCERSAIHIRRGVRLRETAEAAPVGGPLRARLLDLGPSCSLSALQMGFCREHSDRATTEKHMINHEHDNRADHRNEHTVQIQPGYAGRTKEV